MAPMTVRVRERERDIQAACRTWLATHGVMVWKLNTTGIPNGKGGFRKNPSAGMSDLVDILPGGRFLAIEVKRPGGRVTQEQWDFIRDVNEFGGFACVVRGLDELEEQLAPFVRGRLTE